jgi:diguanylate cyclase (GGDEF)-like protein
MAVAMLAAQLAALRQRLRAQKAELAKALARIRTSATRDDLTGLVNRRYAQEVLTLEHQRCMRSGHSFCIAMIDIDRFDAINDTTATPSAMRCCAASRPRRARRSASPTCSRAGAVAEFLLLMTDTRGSLGRLGVDRLRERIARLSMPSTAASLRLTFSAASPSTVPASRPPTPSRAPARRSRAPAPRGPIVSC